jgi:hypothetical protein
VKLKKRGMPSSLRKEDYQRLEEPTEGCRGADLNILCQGAARGPANMIQQRSISVNDRAFSARAIQTDREPYI